MSDTLNRATIIGFLGADPETITSRDGGIGFVRLSIATSVN
jgi:single-stranded DNA-binding protein